jgi:hypothetical protein
MVLGMAVSTAGRASEEGEVVLVVRLAPIGNIVEFGRICFLTFTTFGGW